MTEEESMTHSAGRQMIEITQNPISPEWVIDKVKSSRAGCVVVYVGLIRDNAQGKPVLAVEYCDSQENAENVLCRIADEVRQRWQVGNVAISHRIGKLRVGEINLVVAVASAHRKEGFAACQFVIDQFKQRPPTLKREAYEDGSMAVQA